jgi:hypothetical protein
MLAAAGEVHTPAGILLKRDLPVATVVAVSGFIIAI